MNKISEIKELFKIEKKLKNNTYDKREIDQIRKKKKEKDTNEDIIDSIYDFLKEIILRPLYFILSILIFLPRLLLGNFMFLIFLIAMIALPNGIAEEVVLIQKEVNISPLCYLNDAI